MQLLGTAVFYALPRFESLGKMLFIPLIFSLVFSAFSSVFSAGKSQYTANYISLVELFQRVLQYAFHICFDMHLIYAFSVLRV